LTDPVSPTTTGPQCRLARHLRRRAELALVIRAVRDQPSERGEAGANAGRVVQPPGKRPGGDQLVADIFVYLPVVQHNRPAEIGDQAVEQPMEVDLAQSFGSRGRVLQSMIRKTRCSTRGR
jgi:hypothetical protein